MKKYYANKTVQSDGHHEVHNENCSFLPSIENRKYLGTFSSCVEAVKEAKKDYPKSNGCYYCSNACHTK